MVGLKLGDMKYEYLTKDEQVKESIISNEMNFTYEGENV